MKKKIELSEYKRLLVEMLSEIDQFCEKNGIRYFLISGTLLGAIRHRGFIPWDDDIDIGLLRKDYDLFINTFKSSKKYYRLLSIETDKKYNYPFAKVIDDRVALVEDVDDAVEIGAFIDIFPFDNCVGSTYKEACKSIDNMRFLKWLRNFKILKFSKKRSFWKNVVLFFGKCLTFFCSTRKISKSIINKAKQNEDKECKYVAALVTSNYGYGEVLNRYFFDETIKVEFEGLMFNAPKEYHSILTSFYGNYMELPPKEKQITHHDFECWYK